MYPPRRPLAPTVAARATLFVVPAPGLKIRDPERKDLIEEAGRLVPDSPYWQRRLRDRDVTLGQAAAPQPVPPPVPATPSRPAAAAAPARNRRS